MKELGNKMNILEQCKKCEKRPMCRLGEHEYYQVACEHGCPSFKQKQKKTVTLTNFEWITESPEALAEFIFDTGMECAPECCPVYEECDPNKDCFLNFLDWLNKEEEE